MKAKALIIGLIILVLIGFFVLPRQKNQPPQSYTVKKADIKSAVSGSGSLSGNNAIDLKFQKGGKVTSLNIKTGDKVNAGQLLASLDNREQTISLQQAQNSLRDKQATVDKVLDDIHLFQYGNGGFVNVGTDNETMNQRQLRTQAEVARDNVFDGVKLAQKALEDTLIFAPQAGIITQVNAVEGEVVSSSEAVAKMVKLEDIFFDADLDEADISKISLNQSAEVSLDAYLGKTFKGQVAQIQPQTKTTSSGATVVLVRIKLDELNFPFINGLTGQASIILSESKNVLTIPQEALKEDNTVFIQEGSTLHLKKVVPGIKSDTDVEVKEGLLENEKVLLNPPAQSIGSNRSRNPLTNVLRFLGGGRGR